LDNWNVKNVKEMYGMFQGCNSFRGSLIKWNVENVRELTRFSDNYNFEWPLFRRKMLQNTTEIIQKFVSDYEQVYQSTHNEKYRQLITQFGTVPAPASALTSNDFNPQKIFNRTATIQLEDSTNRANPSDEGYDLMNLENVKVSDYLNSDPNNVVFYMNGKVILFTDKTTIRNILLERGSSIKYKCRSVSTALVPQLGNLDVSKPCVTLNSFGGTAGGMALLGAMKSVLTDSSIRIVEIATPEIDNAVSTASLRMLGPDPNAVGASHCQEGQGDKIYALKKMEMETSGGNKRRSKRNGKRTKRIMKRRHHYRNTRR